MGVLDEVGELKELKQTGPLRDYLNAFDLLLVKVQISKRQALSCFLAGLKHELEMMVSMFNPKPLQKAYSLAKLQEAVKQDPIVSTQGGGRVVYNKIQASLGTFQEAKNNLPLSSSVQGKFNKNSTPNSNNPLKIKGIQKKKF